MKGKTIEKLLIEDIADDGRSLTKYNGLVIFVDKAMPGDLVDVLVTRKHSSYLEGKVTHLHEASNYRIDAFCKHFGICGGCKWQNMQYEAQLFYKQKHVADTMQRIGKISNINVLPIIPSEQLKFYRNKLDYSFSDKKWLSKEQYENIEINKGPALGYHISGRFDQVLDIEECFLQPAPSDAIRNAVKSYALKNNLTFINIRNKSGLLRSLIIRETLKGELMVIVMVYENNSDQLNGLLEFLSESFPAIDSLLYIINPKGNDTFHDLQVHLFKGKDHIIEEMEGLQFRIGPKSFFQTNPAQTLNLYRKARDFADLTGNEIIYDLYTGTGTIANFVARQAKTVIGIDFVADAIADAKINSSLNNINNTDFFAGDMKDLLTASFFNSYGKPNVIITDPPRAGMHQDVVQKLCISEAEKIVYISCNPSTQARDIQLLTAYYDVTKLQPVDMFPHTAHVENIALLIRKN